MSKLESSVEGSVDRYAKKRGCLSRKMNGLGNRSWPDRMYLCCGRTLFIEYKRLGQKPTPLQSNFHQVLAMAGFHVEVVDNVARGKVVIDKFVEG